MELLNSSSNASYDSLSQPEINNRYWLRYELIMVIVFVLGMGLLKHLINYIKKLFALVLWCFKSTSQSKSEVSIGATALSILKNKNESEEFKKDPYQDIVQNLETSLQSSKVEPLEVINRMQKMGVSPDINVYNSLLDSCINSKRFNNANQLFMEIKEPSSLVSPDIRTYNIYLKGMIEAINSGEHIDLSNIRELLKEIHLKEVKPNVTTFDTILEICAIGGRTDLAWDYFLEMQNVYKLLPEATAFTILIKGIKTNEKTLFFVELLQPFLLKFIINKIELVDDTLINAFVDMSEKFTNLTILEEFLFTLRKMQRKLTLMTYGKLIMIYGQQRKSNKIGEIRIEIEREGLLPNEITYGALMESYLKCGLIEKVEEVYQEFVNKGKFSCNVIIYTTLIRALSKKRDFDSAMAIYHKMLRENCKLNLIAYNSLLDCCVKCGKYAEMLRIFEEMLKEYEKPNKGVNSAEPDLITYSTSIKGMCKVGEMGKAMELYQIMKQKGLKLDEILFNSLLDGFAKTEICNTNESEGLIADMAKYKIPFSNYTYSILIKLYAKKKQVDKAINLLNEMKQKGIQPGVIVFTCLLQACIKGKLVEKAIEIFNEMKETHVTPDAVTYNTIVNGCVFSGKLLAACNILMQAIKEDIILAGDIYNNVLRNFPMNHKMTFNQKHLFATEICNYISLRKIQVNQEYLSQTLEKFVFVKQEPSWRPKVNYECKYKPK